MKKYLFNQTSLSFPVLSFNNFVRNFLIMSSQFSSVSGLSIILSIKFTGIQMR